MTDPAIPKVARCIARVQTGHKNTQPPRCSRHTTDPSGYCASHAYLRESQARGPRNVSDTKKR